jgi:GNAT superfamily N-acetyltransferase
MIRTVYGNTEAFHPNEVEYRPAQAGDALGLSIVNQVGFVAGYEGTNPGTTEENLRRFVNGDFAQRNLDFWEAAIQASLRGQCQLPVACYDSVIIAGGSATRTREFYEIDALYCATPGEGIGGHLLGMLLEHQGEMTARLDVTKNARAIGFYKAHGFYITDTRRPMPEQPKVDGIMLHQMEMRRNPQQLTI